VPSGFRIREFTVYVNRSIVSVDFPIGKSPTEAETLTIDHRGSGFGVMICMILCNEFRNIAKPDFLIREGRSLQELLWVMKTFDKGVEERAYLFGPVEQEVLVRAGWTVRVTTLHQSGIREGEEFSLFR
jgi:hypothetical protein